MVSKQINYTTQTNACTLFIVKLLVIILQSNQVIENQLHSKEHYYNVILVFVRHLIRRGHLYRLPGLLS